MNLKEKYIHKLETLGVNKNEIFIEDYDRFSIVSFSDQVDDELLNIAITFFMDNLDYEIIVRRKFGIENRLVSLEKINALNSKYSGVAFYLEGDEIYAIRILEKYDSDVQEILTSITTMIEIILLNDI